MDYENQELRDEAEVEVAEGTHDMKNAEAQSVASVEKATDGISKAPARKGDKKNSEPSHFPKSKAGMVNAMYGKLNAMKKEELELAYSRMMGENVKESEEYAVESADYSEELDTLIESEATLSEEFKQKTAVIFEAALKTKLAEEVERIESAYEEKFAEELDANRSELVEKVDSYLNYVVENWMEENRVAIQSGLRAEIAENFMNNLKDLFVESYIDVPESKIDLVDDLADQVEELEEALNTTTADAIALSEQVEELQREVIISEAVADLADTQAEKFVQLVAKVDFEDAESFASKVSTVKESFFSNSNAVSEEEVITEDSEFNSDVQIPASMERYLSAIRKTNINK
jgi:hypothetical protein